MPALVFLLALAVLAVVVWVRVADRDSAASGSGTPCASAPELPANAAVTVTVLNGAGRDGLASNALNTFAAAGFGRGNFDNTDAFGGVATVTSGPNGTRGALLVSYYVPGSTVATDDRGDNSVTVTLGAKFTALSTPQQAQALIKKAMLSQSVPAPKPGATTSGSSAAATSPSPVATCTTTPPVPTPAAVSSAAG